MTLKTATKIAIAGITLNLIQPFLLPYILLGERFAFDSYMLWRALPLLTLNVPLIIFFVVLYRKQK